jgi:hypothetical protein
MTEPSLYAEPSSANRQELAEALHEGRDHTRDGCELGNTPWCNCYELADKALASPVIARIRAEAYAEGVAAPKVNGQLYHGRASIRSCTEGDAK